jgi:hypothetical protein
MNFIAKVFGKKTPNSITIAAEIEKARKEYDEALANRGAALAGLSMMDDATHQKAEVECEAYRRAADRAAARIVDLEKAHGDAIAAEAEAAKVAAESVQRKRIEAARQAVEVEGANLLREYTRHAAAIADVLTRLAEIDEEAKACRVPGIDPTHRTAPGTQGTEQRAKVPHWVYRDAPPRSDEVYPGKTERAYRATLDDAGKPIPPGGNEYGRFGQIITPTLEQREIVVSRRPARPPRYAPTLNDVRLPPAFEGSYIWPRS